MSMPTELATAVRERRRALGLTQQETGELAGVSAKFIRDFERGKDSVRLDKLTDLLDVLGLALRVEVSR
ncbi:transcriptional regulator [Knoellia sinensis KCTC 19936]|uniref:Transcriptional regulator n=1 Tax=Knoellia sinensis KCTC 19936 TaxID=1385520 RepID=A0A0A0JAB5_9MICO|nr:type II toxin-antitoxin system Y4mF family antitoxin [Knoellia sinensis]KGN32967.1 transcriptional regulator [Knoellia sinensis KCTC 19936]